MFFDSAFFLFEGQVGVAVLLESGLRFSELVYLFLMDFIDMDFAL